MGVDKARENEEERDRRGRGNHEWHPPRPPLFSPPGSLKVYTLRIAEMFFWLF